MWAKFGFLYLFITYKSGNDASDELKIVGFLHYIPVFLCKLG